MIDQGCLNHGGVHELAALEEGVPPVTLKDAERTHIRKILREVDGVIATAATRLGVPRSTLFYKMRRLGISATRAETYRPRAQTLTAHGAGSIGT
jgi:transcriptional regulator of acetoin/glycerol metabolism